MTDENGMSRAKVAHHVAQIFQLREAGHRVVLTAGGATAQGRGKHNRRLIAAGEAPVDPKKETDIQKRSYASRGSGSAYMVWEEEAAHYGIETAQVPATTRETQDEEESRALRELLLHNMELGVVSVINGNDATNPEGIADLAHSRDNDKVAALVARLLRIDHICYLTDVDGLLDDQRLVVPTVTAANYTEALGFIRDEGNGESGGMRSKVTEA
ncbi:MAG TPA: hypothetical protein VN554_00105, partial [Verrucomicrobiae bacterium]|nr:hypothetical protein [Verrucomicrobiae bacterium]